MTERGIHTIIIEKMNRDLALKILGIGEPADKKLIKKRYRALMLAVHPDVHNSKKTEYMYEAHDINAAYEFLAKDTEEKVTQKRKTEAKKTWNAPVNESAYTERDIYQYAEGVGAIQGGIFTAARGKYFRIPDEEHRLFLLSIYNAARELLGDLREETVLKYQGELTYLLFQQFTDPAAVLNKYAVSESENEEIFYIPSMLETEGKVCRLKEGTALYPEGVKDHRLYVRSESGKRAGYISFADDMLYYALIPLFEQRRVSVKIRISGTLYGNNSVRRITVKSLDLWVRMDPSDINELTLSISSRIGKLLKLAREEGQDCL